MIIEYEEKYLNDLRDLLTELEEYIISIDEDELDQLHPEYWEKMAILSLKEAYDNEGICYLAIEDNKVVGAIIGGIRPYEPYDYLDYKCPKAGEVIELIVSKDIRSKGIGHKLMDKLESYFKDKGCEYIGIDVFAYNKNAINFYAREGYHNRMHRVIKKLEQ